MRGALIDLHVATAEDRCRWQSDFPHVAVRRTRAVAEGVKTSRAARDLAQRHSIEMPITTEMYRVLYEDESPTMALQRLMTRTLKAESVH